jgi:copper chaperone
MCSTVDQRHPLTLTDKNHACACSTDVHHAGQQQSTAPEGDAALVREHFAVRGMTCSHCVASVTEELSTLDGVHNVSIDLNAAGPSRVMVVSDHPIAVETIRSAIAEAGYELVTD